MKRYQKLKEAYKHFIRVDLLDKEYEKFKHLWFKNFDVSEFTYSEEDTGKGYNLKIYFSGEAVFNQAKKFLDKNHIEYNIG